MLAWYVSAFPCRKLHKIYRFFYFCKIPANITKILKHLLMRALVQVHDQQYSQNIHPRPNYSVLRLIDDGDDDAQDTQYVPGEPVDLHEGDTTNLCHCCQVCIARRAVIITLPSMK